MKHLTMAILFSCLAGSVFAQYTNLALALKSFPYEELTEATQLAPFVLNFDRSTSNCGAQQSSTISLQPSGGLPPYSYTWFNGSKAATLSDLKPGTYALTVTDTRGAKFQGSIHLEDFQALAIDFIVRPDSNDTQLIEAVINGGTAPFDYKWNNGTAEKELGGLSAGDYNVIVVDKNGCTAGRTITLNEPAPFSFTQNAAAKLINIRPNPTQGIIAIDFPEKFNWTSKVQLFDGSGQYLREYPSILPLTKSMEIDLSGMQNGIYFVRIEWGGQSVIKKIVLVRG